MAFDKRVEAHHRVLFGDNFMLATQNMGSLLRPHVTEKPCGGEGAVAADLVGQVNYKRRGERSRTNIDNPVPRDRRWLIYRDPIETGQYLDKEDKWRCIETPDNEIMQAHAAAAGRGVDDTILGLDEDGNVGTGGILGKVSSGKRVGDTITGLPSEHITVHGSSGLTIAKLRAARKKLGLSENDMDRYKPVMALTTTQNDDLLGVVENGGEHFNLLEQPHIIDGKVHRLLGFTFVEMNRLPKKGTTRSCPVWMKHQVVLGVWQDLKPDLYNDTHAGNTPYMKIDAVIDATRKEDLGVHIIECSE